MTSGGGLSYNHPGALGLLLLVEAVRQLRGEAGDRQVPNAMIGVAHGVGGLLSRGHRGARERVRMFFFEKKNQKTFIHSEPPRQGERGKASPQANG